MGVAKRLAMRLDRVASFNTVSEHTTLFEELHDRAAHLAGAAAVYPAQILHPKNLTTCPSTPCPSTPRCSRTCTTRRRTLQVLLRHADLLHVPAIGTEGAGGLHRDTMSGHQQLQCLFTCNLLPPSA